MAASALAQPLWERDEHGDVLYDRPIRSPTYLDSKILRFVSRQELSDVAESTRSSAEMNGVSPNVMAIITAAAEVVAVKMKNEMPDTREVSRSVVLEVLKQLGIDVNDNTSVEKFKDNQRFTTNWRESFSKMWGHAQLVFVGLIVVGISLMIWSKVTPPQPYMPIPQNLPVNPSTGRP